ncbi:ROK family protein [Alicyclobacillus sp. SO9]|uniref:ROK family protein n=1 Tax=Alicyclobacillus sp. SO9 TaxID=2665646 RepID=UPI0018E724FB|nr:ROK family protein [Alicyclobacillus sp. SO9]QQE78417.1 ROK family protein [Alicyclobacillus sp. SO9]
MKYVLGIDIGGTNIKAALVNSEGELTEIRSIPTNAYKGRDYVLQNLHSLIREFVRHPGIQGIGIASAGRINYKSCIVEYATDNLPNWTNLNFNKEISEVYHLPIAVDNDVNAAANGEAWKGEHQECESMFFLALGTGVGGGFILNNEIVRGHTWSFAEVGHWSLYPDGLFCNCGSRGCSEQYVSGSALHRRISEIIEIRLKNPREIWSESIQLHPSVEKIIDNYFDDLALLLRQVQLAFDPECIIIGGGVAEDHSKFKHILSPKLGNGSDRIHFATLGNKAGIIGAAKLIFDMC